MFAAAAGVLLLGWVETEPEVGPPPRVAGWLAPMPRPFPARPSDAQRPVFWEREVQAVEQRLARQKLGPGGVAFCGSSTIRLWKLAEYFPGMAAANCGFGGCEVRDATFFLDRLGLPQRPAKFVLYAGDNDLASDRTPKQVADDAAAFCARVKAELPDAKILILGVKPSPLRILLRAEQKQANALQAALAASDPTRISLLDLDPLFLDGRGAAIIEDFADDRLHLSAKGYAKLSKAVKAWLGGK